MNRMLQQLANHCTAGQYWGDDRARDTEGVDFVELCGTQTLALKDCTDAHPEYYGEIAGKDEPEAPPEEAAAAASS